jgi:hypothetical protein
MDVQALLADEDSGWIRLCAAVERFDDELLRRPGVTPDGWAVRDVLFHIAAWAADCGQQLERIRAGTFVPPDEDVEEQNRRWFELSRTMDVHLVRAELAASRTRMIEAFATLPEVTADAVEWFEESGALHYHAHVADLEAWAVALGV